MDDLKKFSNLPQYAAGEGACPVKTVRFRYLKKKLKNVRSNIWRQNNKIAGEILG